MKIILQQDIKDCGVACIQYMIEYYHGLVPVSVLREDLHLTNQGTTAYHLVETLKKYQFDACGKKIEYDDLKDVILPAIVHLILPNGILHFAILNQVEKKGVVLMDPASGKKKMSKEEFLKIWDKVVILATPITEIPHFEKKSYLKPLVFKILRMEKKWFIGITCFILLLTLSNLLSPLIIKIILENFVIFRDQELYICFTIFVLLSFLKLVLEYLKNKFQRYLSKNLDIHFIYSFINHLFRLPQKKLKLFSKGELTHRFQEVLDFKELFLEISLTFILNLIIIVFTFFLLGKLHHHIIIILLCEILLSSFVSYFLSKRYFSTVLEMLENKKRLHFIYQNNLDIHTTIKNLNMVDYQSTRLNNDLNDYREQCFMMQEKLNHFAWIRTSIYEISILILNLYAFYLFMQKMISITDFMMMQSLYLFFIESWNSLMNLGPKYFYVKGIWHNLRTILEIDEENFGLVEPLEVINIEIKNLSYSYNQVQYVLKNLNLNIKNQEHIFLNGKSGLGKSTLCQIIIKDIENYQGDILINQKNIKDYSHQQIKSSILYLSQNETIFQGTIKENIMLESKDKERFLKIIDICRLDIFVSKRTLKYETSIMECNLSGGELQRIKLARILMKDASCYILDEALSEVDEQTEIDIIKNIKLFLKAKTLIYISHRHQRQLFDRCIDLEECLSST